MGGTTMSELIKRTYDFSESVSATSDRISGYASVFYDGTEKTEYKIGDNVFERIDRNAFNNSIANKKDVIASYDHKYDQVLARTSAGTLSLSIDSKGLKYEFAYDNTDPDHQRCLSKIKRKEVTGSSFTGTAKNQSWSKEGSKVIKTITEIDLIEVCPCVFPAYQGTKRSELSDSDKEQLAKMETENLLSHLDLLQLNKIL